MIDIEFEFTAELWLYQGHTAWHLMNLPKEESQQIKFYTSGTRRGWGAVRVLVKIGETEWKTSVFPDSKAGCYLLPVKKEVRKAEGLKAKDQVTAKIKVSAGL